jgi:toxoflavin synthase
MKEAVYDSIGQKYQKIHSIPLVEYLRTYTYTNLLGDVAGKSILDLACGEGFYTRLLKKQAVASIVGVDLSLKMIELARLEEEKEPLGIEYINSDVLDIGFIQSFDLVVASFLLNFASTKEQLLKMCQIISTNLKSGGRFITLNNNLELPPEFYHKGEKYGEYQSCASSLKEGITINVTYTFNDSEKISFDNYYLSKATYEWALSTAGFKDICWHNPTVSPEGLQKFGQNFWQDAIDYPTIIGITCIKL